MDIYFQYVYTPTLHVDIISHVGFVHCSIHICAGKIGDDDIDTDMLSCTFKGGLIKYHFFIDLNMINGLMYTVHVCLIPHTNKYPHLITHMRVNNIHSNGLCISTFHILTH